MELETRNRTMDIVKAIGIILVVVGHSGSPFTKFIYLFHMALFFFVSGYFYNDKYSKNPWDLVQKRLKSLWVPFVWYSTILLLLHNVFCKIQIYSNNEFYKDSAHGMIQKYNLIKFLDSFGRILCFERTEQLAGAFWFFETLFIVNIIFVIMNFYINRFIKSTYQEIIRLILILGIFFIGVKCSYANINTTKNFEVALVTIMFFYWGYLYKKYEKNIKINNFLLPVCLGILIYNSFKGQINLVTNTIINPFFLLFNSVIGIYLIMGISSILNNMKINLRNLNCIGKNTVVILCLHFLAFRIVNFGQVLIYELPYYKIASHSILNGKNGWWIAYSLIGIFIPLLIKQLTRYIINKFISKK